MKLHEKFDWSARTYVMGILNATPDSFSGDGIMSEPTRIDAAAAQAKSFVDAGADILDIGGESTRPGAAPVTPAEEIRRVVPVIEAVRQTCPDTPISIDTYRAETAKAALQAGADIINDVRALQADREMAGVAALFDAPVILMHNRSRPGDANLDARLGGEYQAADYGDVLQDVFMDLGQLAHFAVSAGIARDQIILDPGIGFGKTLAQNLKLLNGLDVFAEQGFPLLVGPSRKSFIGRVLDLPVEDRLEGTLATIALCIDRGANIVRVHDVAAAVRVARMTDAVIRNGTGYEG